MTGSGPARLFGWTAAGVASAALLSTAALALTLVRKDAPEPLFLTLAPLPPAALSVAALADPAPAVTDAAPDLPAPAPHDDAAPKPPAHDPGPTLAPVPTLGTPVAEAPVLADLSIPEPKPEPRPVPRPKAKPEPKAKTPEPRPKADRETAEPTEKPTPKAPEPGTGKAAASSASAPTTGARPEGGKRTAPAAYAKAVMKKVRATKRKSGAGRGTVVVGFTIGRTGMLAGVSVLQSSGNAALDRIAVDHIHRSAPFPAPPEGAGTSYSFEFVGR